MFFFFPTLSFSHHGSAFNYVGGLGVSLKPAVFTAYRVERSVVCNAEVGGQE